MSDSPSAASHQPLDTSSVSWWSGAFVAALIGLGQLPLLRKFQLDLATREQYEFYPLVLLAAGFLAWDRLRDVPASAIRRGGWWVAAPMLLLALGLSALGGFLYMRWFAAPAAWITLAAAVWRLLGPSVARTVAPAGVLLLVTIPPPFHLDTPFTQWLQSLAVRGSSGLLDLLHLPHVMSGTVIEIPGHRLLIEEACSGINSLMSVIAFTLLLVFLKRRSVIISVALLVAAVWFVVWANIARITLGAVLQARYGINILDESTHMLAGLILFAICVGLVLSADQFLLLIASRRPSLRRPAGRGSSQSGPATRSRSGPALTLWPGVAPTEPAQDRVRLSRAAADASPAATARAPFAAPGMAWWTLALAFGIVGLLTHLRVKDCWPVSRLPGTIAVAPPQKVGAWERVESGDVFNERTESFGKYAHRWRYRRDGMTAEISLAYPFTTGYHDPAVCYGFAGWTIAQRASHGEAEHLHSPLSAPGSPLSALRSPLSALGSQPPYFEMTMEKLASTRGHLFFAAFDEQTRWHAPRLPTPPQGRLAYTLWLSRQVANYVPTHEIQTLVVQAGPIDEQQRRQVEELFLVVRSELARQAVEYLNDDASQAGK